jgi:peptide/nickel transport system substrate-binding protein
MKPLDDPDVRQALKYAIDREEILKTIFNGHGSIGNDQPITPAYNYYNDKLPAKSYDPDKARFHLKKAGLDMLEFDFRISDAAFSGAVDLSVLYQKQAAKAGIKINVIRDPADGYYAIVAANQPACYMTWWAGRATENTMLTVGFSETSPWNYSRWRNPEFNSLLAAARQEMDEAKRREYYYTLQRIVSEDSGVIIPIFANLVSALNSKVQHAENVSSEWEFDGGRIVERWWMA